jgi:hypothetical protein
VAAGAAGLSAAGYAGCAAFLPLARADGNPVQRFWSRPDLTPPVVTVTSPGGLPGALSARRILVTPAQGGPGQGGAMITDAAGELTWFAPASQARRVMNLAVQEYRGAPVLTWWQGRVVDGHGEGEGVIADSAYRTIATVRAAGALLADLHEFVITPQGTALITAYRRRVTDLSAVGGPARAVVLSGVAQEIDIATGRLVLEWDSLDHVPVTDTYLRYAPGREDLDAGTSGQPFDYFHINSIAAAPDGDLIVSARNTSTVYKLRRRDGALRWRLGGRRSHFAMGPGTRFWWQHDARPDGTGLTLFDDGASPAREPQSRGLAISLDTTAMRATLTRQYLHPSGLLATAMGSTRRQPDGSVFVGYGTEPSFSLFSAGGKLLLDGSLPVYDNSYRAFLADWSGQPAEPPAAAARSGRQGPTTVYASWNGATGVASWAALAGRDPAALTAVGRAARDGFETAVTVGHAGPYFAAEARDDRGRVLGRSSVVRAGLDVSARGNRHIIPVLITLPASGKWRGKAFHAERAGTVLAGSNRREPHCGRPGRRLPGSGRDAVGVRRHHHALTVS